MFALMDRLESCEKLGAYQDNGSNQSPLSSSVQYFKLFRADLKSSGNKNSGCPQQSSQTRFLSSLLSLPPFSPESLRNDRLRIGSFNLAGFAQQICSDRWICGNARAKAQSQMSGTKDLDMSRIKLEL
ncbi:hypothetical protein PoB_006753700 [Plakobranchus ocellatus]|uniref:Uncharacterized protein n=1 Tax=Plakobranchus ocellatus TaxID=259542 RepID=A0AAV4DAH5_9GAST|nr:hypothetical protein PoB_006753700 [Plakobranchus ocellatus]